jgi:uncharacterized membrane protein
MKVILKNFLKELVLFTIGGVIYNLIEIAYRGYTHWSMFIVGGICFCLVGLINEFFDWDFPTFHSQCIIGAIIITTLEYISGYIVNIKLGWYVWDYSNKFLNINGQICLQSFVYWIILSAIAILLDDYIRYRFFKEEKPHYKL